MKILFENQKLLQHPTILNTIEQDFDKTENSESIPPKKKARQLNDDIISLNNNDDKNNNYTNDKTVNEENDLDEELQQG